MLLKEELFQKSLKNLYTPKDLLRSRAWERFLQIGLPKKGSEAFAHVPLQDLFAMALEAKKEQELRAEEISRFIPKECKESSLVFLNGNFSPFLSSLKALPNKSVLLPLEQAKVSYYTLLQNRFERTIERESDPFALLNAALYEEGVFLYVPSKVRLTLHCLDLIASENENSFIAPKLAIFLGAHAEMELKIETRSLTKGSSLTTSYLDASLEEGAKLKISRRFNEEERSWRFDSLRATLKRESSLSCISSCEGGKSVRQNYSIELLGEKSEVELKGLTVIKENRKAQTDVRIEHQVPNTRSMQHFKNVLYDASRTSFSGKIVVLPEAQKTNAYQRNENLILGEHAIAYGKPNLEIFADDVKASHGATVGQLDKRQLFYLQSRGIEKEEAKEMLIAGFCRDILDLI
jgi:Fe-S cluster assembly protein SufD